MVVYPKNGNYELRFLFLKVKRTPFLYVRILYVWMGSDGHVPCQLRTEPRTIGGPKYVAILELDLLWIPVRMI